MPMEQISKLQEVLHLFKMESQDIFETKWLTQIALPFTDGSRKAFTHLVNTGLYKDNTKVQNTTSTTAKTQTSLRPTTATASTMMTRPTTTPRYQHSGLSTKKDLRTILKTKQTRRDWVTTNSKVNTDITETTNAKTRASSTSMMPATK